MQHGEKKPGKIDTPLGIKLRTVKWGEYRIGDLFDVLSYKQRFDANKVSLTKDNGHPYIVRQSYDNGQKGYIDENEIYLNEGNTISFGQDTATMFYQEKPYFTGDKIKVLKPKLKRFCKNNAQFFLATMRRSFSNFSWGTSSFNIQTIQNQKVTLPISKSGKIDFDFMDSFIRELEEERIRELEEERIRELAAYLEASGLASYDLTGDEQATLLRFKNAEWKEFRYDEIFNHIEQGRRLKKEDQKPGNIPFVMSGITNTGVVNYISNPVASFPANSLTVDIFGNTFYRNFAYGLGDDTGAYWNDQKEYTRKHMLFFSTAVEKSLEGKFSYGHKLRSSQSFGFKMFLPVKNGNPDYDLMETFISALQKLVIKDVVQFADKRIEASREAIIKESEGIYHFGSSQDDKMAAETSES